METREFWPFENICQFLPPTASSQAKATLRPENLFKHLTASSIPTRDASKESNPGKSSVPHRLALSSSDSLAKTGDSIAVAADSHVKPSTSSIGACIRCINECACVLLREVGLIEFRSCPLFRYFLSLPGILIYENLMAVVNNVEILQYI